MKEKQVVIAKIDGKQNPADALTKHLVTGEVLRIARERLGIDLTQAGLGKHVSKHGVTSVSAVNAQTDNTLDACEPWKPLMGSKLSLRAYHSSVQRNKKVTPYVKDGGGTQCLRVTPQIGTLSKCLLAFSLALNISMVLCICSVGLFQLGRTWQSGKFHERSRRLSL